MSGSIVIEVAIGLIVVYLTFSLFCSAINEWIARFLALRAAGLRKGINELFDDVSESGFAALFHQHPLIDALKPTNVPWIRRALPSAGKVKYPSYISSHTFSIAVMDLATDITSPGGPGIAVRALLKEPSEMTAPLPESLRALLVAVDGDAAAMQARLERWFDDSMDRVSGWYKRRTHVILFVLGLIVAAAFNIDTFRIANQLANEPSMREALVKQADLIVASANQRDSLAARDTTAPKPAPSVSAKEIANQIAAIQAAGLTLGWPKSCSPALDAASADSTASAAASCGWSWASLVGIFVTAIALSFGAPFWFDALNKLTNLRQSGTPPDGTKK